MKPWVHADKSGLSSFRSGTFSAHVWFVSLWGCGRLCCDWRSAAPTELNKWVSMPNPGLAPWAMKKYRPVGALQRQHHDNEYHIHENKYEVFTSVSTRKHFGKYAYSRE